MQHYVQTIARLVSDLAATDHADEALSIAAEEPADSSAAQQIISALLRLAARAGLGRG